MTNIVEVKTLSHVIFYYSDGTKGTAYFYRSKDLPWTQSGDTLIDPPVLDTMWKKLKRQGYI